MIITDTYDSASNITGYGELAARIAISNLHKETEESFSKTIEMEYKYVSRNSVSTTLSPHYNVIVMLILKMERRHLSLRMMCMRLS